MFYDTLVVGGTPEPKAQLMFAAVWLGGPRWYPRKDRPEVSRGMLVSSRSRPDISMELLPTALRRAALVDTRNFIESSKPSFANLLLYLKWKEWEMKRVASEKSGTPPVDPNAEVIAEETVADPISPITGGGGSAGAVQGP